MLGTALREARRRAGLTQEELAHRAQIDRSYISLLENDRKSPTLDMLIRIAGTLGVRAWQLVKTAEEKPTGRQR